MKCALGVIVALFAFFGCDDTTGQLGINMLPQSDSISAHTATYEVKTRSVLAERVYAKSSTGYVGRFTDPDFGYYESNFLSELTCVEGYEFPETYQVTSRDESGKPLTATGTMVEEDPLVSASLIFYYDDWYGDSLNACRMNIYELNDQWKADRNDSERRYRYTDIDTEKYKGKLLGQLVYSAYDTTVPDSVRNATDSQGYPTYQPHLTLDFPKDRAQEIFDLNRTHPEFFANQEAFIENVFPGLYAESDYGDGTILYVDYIYLTMRFRFYAVDEETGLKLTKKLTDENGAAGTDSIVEMQSSILASTKEVIQANSFANDRDILEAKVNENNWTYLKSPAGIFTEAEMPYDEIAEELANDTLNAVSLSFSNYHQESTHDFSMDAPDEVLLIRKQDVERFFEENELPDNITSYTTTHNAVAANQYTFSNISRLMTTCINEKKESMREAGITDEAEWEAANPDWNKVWLIPVNTLYDTSQTTERMIGIEHNLQPSYAKLKGGEATNPDGSLTNPLTLEVTYTTFYDK